jgi:hypothetical protein
MLALPIVESPLGPDVFLHAVELYRGATERVDGQVERGLRDCRVRDPPSFGGAAPGSGFQRSDAGLPAPSPEHRINRQSQSQSQIPNPNPKSPISIRDPKSIKSPIANPQSAILHSSHDPSHWIQNNGFQGRIAVL